MKRIIAILYIKYVLKVCKCSCLLCPYKKQCLDSLTEEYNIKW